MLLVHVASVWVPFTSESKEAIADYPEVNKQIRLAVQDCARRLRIHVSRQRRQSQELKKRQYIEKYIPHIGDALADILSLKPGQKNTICRNLTEVLEKTRKF